MHAPVHKQGGGKAQREEEFYFKDYIPLIKINFRNFSESKLLL